MSGDNGPLVRLATLRKRTSKNGNEYFSGWLGDSTLLLFRDPDADSDQWGEAWKLLAQERQSNKKNQRGSNERAD